MIYPESYEVKTGFDKIRILLKDFCISNLGRDKVDSMRFSSNVDGITMLMEQTAEFQRIITEGDEFPAAGFCDVRHSLHHIKADGSHLSENELHDIRNSLEAIRSVTHFICAKNEQEYPRLHTLTEGVSHFPDIIRHIDGIVDKFGHIKDNATPELANIRREKNRIASSISGMLNDIIRKAQSDGFLEKDVTPAIREGRLVIPVPPAFKRKLNGIVHDESASGKTVFMEPTVVVEANNRVRSLESEEKREILRILVECSNFIRPYIEELFLSYHFLGKIDFIRAKAMFADSIGAAMPQISASPVIEWQHACHPLLLISLRQQGKELVPLDIKLDAENRILIISGPNAGGKSVCLKTVGLVQYMGQCGMLPPMAKDSRFGIFGNLFIDIGDEQSIENDLSTYSSHLTNMKHFIKHGNHGTLLLIDEFGTGTEPMIGGAIAEAELEIFGRNGCFGVITTHYTNLKHIAAQTDGMVNGAMLYDRHRMEPLFQLAIGNPGSSFAIEIARKIGLPEEIIASATEKVGAEHINYDKNLQDIVRDKRYWESKRQQIKIKERKMDDASRSLQRQLDEIERKRKEIIREAKEEAKVLLADTNATIENTIRQIKEAKAEKEKTKSVRREFEQSRRQLESDDNHTSSAIHKKSVKEATVAKGDHVRYNGSIGEVLQVTGNRVTVAFGQMEATIATDKVEKVSNNQLKEHQQKNTINFITPETSEKIRQKKLNFKRDIDVRGMRGEEALMAITYYIDDAILSGVGQVRILHGTGTGALRQLIRQYLGTVAGVRTFHDEHVQFGGAGITVVEFD